MKAKGPLFVQVVVALQSSSQQLGEERNIVLKLRVPLKRVSLVFRGLEENAFGMSQ